MNSFADRGPAGAQRLPRGRGTAEEIVESILDGVIQLPSLTERLEALQSIIQRAGGFERLLQTQALGHVDPTVGSSEISHRLSPFGREHVHAEPVTNLESEYRRNRRYIDTRVDEHDANVSTDIWVERDREVCCPNHNG
jgi:3',5'-cyclic AMP phosphodiesterase CpdA